MFPHMSHPPHSSYVYHRHFFFSTFTTTKSEAASYEFTTLTCIPGVHPFFLSHPFFPICRNRILSHISPFHLLFLLTSLSPILPHMSHSHSFPYLTFVFSSPLFSPSQVIHHKDCRIQLLDLPGIIEGASEGKGRGRQVRESTPA